MHTLDICRLGKHGRSPPLLIYLLPLKLHCNVDLWLSKYIHQYSP